MIIFTSTPPNESTITSSSLTIEGQCPHCKNTPKHKCNLNEIENITTEEEIVYIACIGRHASCTDPSEETLTLVRLLQKLQRKSIKFLRLNGDKLIEIR